MRRSLWFQLAWGAVMSIWCVGFIALGAVVGSTTWVVVNAVCLPINLAVAAHAVHLLRRAR